jgi:hypothetical protein
VVAQRNDIRRTKDGRIGGQDLRQWFHRRPPSQRPEVRDQKSATCPSDL